MSKTRRRSSKSSQVDENDEGQTKQDHRRSRARKRQRKFKEALRGKNLEAIEIIDDYMRY